MIEVIGMISTVAGKAEESRMAIEVDMIEMKKSTEIEVIEIIMIGETIVEIEMMENLAEIILGGMIAEIDILQEVKQRDRFRRKMEIG